MEEQILRPKILATERVWLRSLIRADCKLKSTSMLASFHFVKIYKIHISI